MKSPRTARCFFRTSSLPRSGRGSAQLLRQYPVFVKLNAPWFRSYCKAVLEGDPVLTPVYVKDAAVAITEALGQTNVDEEERDAMCIATR